MTVWYKYNPEQYIRMLVDEGKLRLHKLQVFHEVDRYGEAIGDVEEGHLTAQVSTPQNRAVRGSELGPFEQQNFGRFTNRALFINSTFIVRDNPANSAYDYYIYCCTIDSDLGILEKINEENERANLDRYDACAQINNHHKFRLALAENLKTEHGLEMAGSGNCYYAGRVVNPYDFKGPTLAALRKPPSLEWQKETRLVFRGPKDGPEHIDACEPRLIEHVEFKTLL